MRNSWLSRSSARSGVGWAALVCLSLAGCGNPAAQPRPSVQPVLDITSVPAQDTAATAAALIEDAIPTATPSAYTVQSGDTLSGIAERFGITVNDIATLNSITDTGHILAGQTLLVPAPYLPTPALTVTATATPVITGTAPPLVIEPDAIVTPEPDTIVTDTNTVIP